MLLEQNKSRILSIGPILAEIMVFLWRSLLCFTCSKLQRRLVSYEKELKQINNIISNFIDISMLRQSLFLSNRPVVYGCSEIIMDNLNGSIFFSYNIIYLNAISIQATARV